MGLGPFWTPTENKILARAYKSGCNMRQMLELLPNRTEPAILHEITREGLSRKYELLTKDKKLGHFDIETSQLNASFGFMISWALKSDNSNSNGGNIEYDALTRRDFLNAGYEDPDKRIVASMVKALNKYDVITFHFGEYFDGPFARTRALLYNLDFPEYGQVQQVDTWRLAKKLLKLHSNRLDTVAEYFNINTKTHLSPAIWRRATRGDMRAVNYIVEHNVQDVVTLEKVYHKLAKYNSGARKSL